MKLNLNRNKRYAIPIMTHPGIELIEKTVKAAVTDGIPKTEQTVNAILSASVSFVSLSFSSPRCFMKSLLCSIA